jgi:hypothetical protein
LALNSWITPTPPPSPQLVFFIKKLHNNLVAKFHKLVIWGGDGKIVKTKKKMQITIILPKIEIINLKKIVIPNE